VIDGQGNPPHDFGKTTPIFRIFDEAKAKVGFLGFKIDWEHRFEPSLPLYMQISKDCIIHLSEHHGDCTPGGAVRNRNRRHRQHEPAGASGELQICEARYRADSVEDERDEAHRPFGIV
jgi:hypothetical protein